jgi:hypothetical protein
MERTHFDHREIEEFVGQISLIRQAIERNYTGPASANLILLSITMTQLSGENINNRIKEKN